MFNCTISNLEPHVTTHREVFALVLVDSENPYSVEKWELCNENRKQRCCVDTEMVGVVLGIKAGEKETAKYKHLFLMPFSEKN